MTLVSEHIEPDTRERILVVAERLFREIGYQKTTVADIAKVYGIPEREARRFTEHMPHFMGDAVAVVESMPECRDLPWQEEPYRTIVRLAPRFEGIPRHASMHPCGLVIGGGPSRTACRCSRAPKATSPRSTPWTMSRNWGS